MINNFYVLLLLFGNSLIPPSDISFLHKNTYIIRIITIHVIPNITRKWILENVISQHFYGQIVILYNALYLYIEGVICRYEKFKWWLLIFHTQFSWWWWWCFFCICQTMPYIRDQVRRPVWWARKAMGMEVWGSQGLLGELSDMVAFFALFSRRLYPSLGVIAYDHITF